MISKKYSETRITNPAVTINNADLLMLTQDISGTKTSTIATALEVKQYVLSSLSNVDNTSDVNKPVSTEQAASIATKLGITANAVSATKLVTARTINGVSFDGTDNITVADSSKEPAITAGTTAQYWRGDKSWQTLDKTSVGLSDVDNTSDVNKPISTATQTALNSINTSQITAGTLNIARLPAASIERLKIVVDQAARYALTTADVQNGDTVKHSGDGLMFFVKDDINLGNSSGYEPYTVGAASSVSWSGVTDTPTTLAGYGITDAATTGDLSGKEPTITAGTTDQYWRGDKSWQTLPTALTNPMTAVGDIIYGGASGAPTRLGIGTSGYVLTASSGNPVWQLLDKTSVGLSNVDNTSDVNKPISTATQTALDTKPTKTAVNLYTKNQTVTPFTLTSGSTVSVDASQSNNFKLVLGVNATLANPTNLSDGMVFNFKIKQDATGSRTLAYGSKYKFAGGVAGVLSTAANATDLLSCYYDSTNDVLLCSLSKGFA